MSNYYLLDSELETKRILLDIFKAKQQKSAEAGTIPSFYKKVSFQKQIRHFVRVLGFFLFPPEHCNCVCAFRFQKPEEGSISHRVQRLAKYRFLKVFGMTLCFTTTCRSDFVFSMLAVFSFVTGVSMA